MRATERLGPAGVLSTGFLLALLLLAWSSPRLEAEQTNRGRTVSPLPASDYTLRSVCPPPTTGHAGCMALQLIPRTQAARAHTHPLGRARRAPIRAGNAAKVCEPPRASENCYGLRPQDLHRAYDLPTNSAVEQTVALVDAYDDPDAEADLKVYDEEFGLPPCTSANGCFTKVNEKGRATPLPETEGGWAVEISLDIEIAHAVCQNCHILLVEASNASYANLESAEETAVRLGATEISNSWSGGEPSTDSPAFDHPGVAITAAAGDDGYLNWQSQNPDVRGSVGYPASSPHVVAVGGTRLSLTSEGSWAGETVWNGDGATGGGCSEHFEAPSWQLKLADWSAVGCQSMRAVADVSADADPYTGVAVYDSTPAPEGETTKEVVPGWISIGGTSLSSPLIAATFALAGGASDVEYPAKTLYENELTSPTSLHDVESGSSGECQKSFDYETGLSGCTASEEAQSSCSGRLICMAGPGYDGPTGVGSPSGLDAFQPPTAPSMHSQTIRFTSSAPTAATVAGPSYVPTASASSGLTVSLSSATPQVCAISESTVGFIGAGTCTIDADQAGNSSYEAAAQVQQSFAVGKGSQHIAFTTNPPNEASPGAPPYMVSATASSALPVSFSSETPSVCSVEGQTVSFLSAGTCTVDANQAGSANYEQAPQVQQSLTVSKRAQSVTFTSSPPSSATVGGAAYPVSASASSALEVSFSSETSDVCVVDGSSVRFVDAGTCTVEAEQPGNGEYYAAPRVQQSFAVAPEPIPPAPPTPSPSPTPSTPSTPSAPSTPSTPSTSSTPFESVPSASQGLAPSSPIAPTPDNEFTLFDKTSINNRTGTVVLTVSVVGAGRLSALLTFRNGTFGTFPANKGECGTGQIKLSRECNSTAIVFGKELVQSTTAGDMRIEIAPSASARKALENAHARHKGLPVTVQVTFLSSLGGTAVEHEMSLIVTLAPARGKRRA